MITHPNVKLNLGLSVIRRREDGFHDLETLFVPYTGISDTLEIVPADAFSIDILRKEGVDWDPQQDLTAKAYRLLEADFHIPPVHIRLTKTSPVGAGLGGGSADAAFALRMLNDLFGLSLDDGTLASYAARLGSDCAFFIYNRPMLGSGRGEILTPYDIDLSGYEIQVVVPEGIAVNTREAYGGITPREKLTEAPVALMDALSLPVEEWKNALVNDFEATVFKAHPELASIKQSLYDSGAIYAAMSGSGSALFALYRR
ncbi:MAG: 4-(cytidine 5'-diphospho)-2-C-methyl-D-erythritol kinase [Bacteroidales bacterium]|nr:4-(cytidine 5'-diphospho)-2-C-methyl-D-erythritol kinase [Candidatus Cryptobacteroides onthequi]